MKQKKIAILGAGISGLATAYWLNKDGFDIQIFEAKDQPGGSMQTIFKEGFLIDFGPNSGLETTPLIRQMAEELGISDKMIYANSEAEKRYILKNGNLLALPTSPKQFIKSKLFSLGGKLRLGLEPFIGKSSDGYYQSIAQFVTRRLGKEFLDYAIDPFVSGVFAGDPSKLSVKSAFPKLYRLEEIYGGLVKGMIKGAKERKARKEESKQSAKMFSFINGMQSFPQAISNILGNKINYSSSIESVKKVGDKWVVRYTNNGSVSEHECDAVLSTLPSYVASKVFNSIDENLASHLDSIYYPPVLVLYIAFNKSDIGQELDGFGFLIPQLEKKNFLGAIWSSIIFPNRAHNEKVSFTLFVGGARSPQILDQNIDDTISNALKEFKSIMKIEKEPLIQEHRMWNKAIPQYNIGYIEHENYFDGIEKQHTGLFLSGNYRGGISVGDCIKNSEIVYNKIKNNLKN